MCRTPAPAAWTGSPFCPSRSRAQYEWKRAHPWFWKVHDTLAGSRGGYHVGALYGRARSGVQVLPATATPGAADATCAPASVSVAPSISTARTRTVDNLLVLRPVPTASGADEAVVASPPTMSAAENSGTHCRDQNSGHSNNTRHLWRTGPSA